MLNPLALAKSTAATPRMVAGAYQQCCFNASTSSSNDTHLTFQLRRLTEEVARLEDRCAALEGQQNLDLKIKLYAAMQRTPLVVDQVVASCQRDDYHTDLFCHRELPVILAHLISKVDRMPNHLPAMSRVRELRKVLTDAFKALIDCPVPIAREEKESFIEVVRKVERDLAEFDCIKAIAQGVVELRATLSRHRLARTSSPEDLRKKIETITTSLSDDVHFQDSIDDFYMCFVQFVFLSQQLVSVWSQAPAASGSTTSRGTVGVIDTDVQLKQVVDSASFLAGQPCEEVYGEVPKVEISFVGDGNNARISHIVDKLVYILTELLKNSFRATIETHGKRDETGMYDPDSIPPVKVQICLQGEHHASLVVSDQGGGITREDMKRIMSYAYTTAPVPALLSAEEEKVVKLSTNGNNGDTDDASSSADTSPRSDMAQEISTLAGYGYGLPMSRIYARMFGGDVRVQSIEGYGTKAILYVKIEPSGRGPTDDRYERSNRGC